ncbi:hypothetical protein QLX67_10800 [Balneolaceae bacterium ANBcel3]|nr:hypothetical protein [Balneolaceae bacterium ANBcel3]
MTAILVLLAVGGVEAGINETTVPADPASIVSTALQDTVHFAVLSFRPKNEVAAKWQPLLD